jgi:hypothetical protein
MSRGYVDVISFASPYILNLVIFWVYLALYGSMDASKAYTLLALFNLIRTPLRFNL